MIATTTPRADASIPRSLPPPGVGIDPMSLTLVGVDTGDDPSHPLWDDLDEVDEDLAESLGEHGQQQSILVRKNGPRIEVVSGRERTKAARLWNAANPDRAITLFWRLSRGNDDARLRELVVIENEHRKEKSIVWRARRAQAMHDMDGKSWTDIARVFRVTPQTVQSWRETLDAASPILEAVIGEEFTAADAREVTELTHKDQVAVLEIARDEGTTLGEAMDLAGVRPPGRRGAARGAAGRPSGRPGVAELRAARDDKSIPDDEFTWREVVSWALGERPEGLELKRP